MSADFILGNTVLRTARKTRKSDNKVCQEESKILLENKYPNRVKV